MQSLDKNVYLPAKLLDKPRKISELCAFIEINNRPLKAKDVKLYVQHKLNRARLKTIFEEAEIFRNNNKELAKDCKKIPFKREILDVIFSIKSIKKLFVILSVYLHKIRVSKLESITGLTRKAILRMLREQPFLSVCLDKSEHDNDILFTQRADFKGLKDCRISNKLTQLVGIRKIKKAFKDLINPTTNQQQRIEVPALEQTDSIPYTNENKSIAFQYAKQKLIELHQLSEREADLKAFRLMNDRKKFEYYYKEALHINDNKPAIRKVHIPPKEEPKTLDVTFNLPAMLQEWLDKKEAEKSQNGFTTFLESLAPAKA